MSVSSCRYAVAVMSLMSAVALLLSCSKQKAENAPSGDHVPLLTTTDELAAAISGAGDRMLLLDFYADWCLPCRILEPTLNEIARENKAKILLYRINVDRSPELARQFGVRGIPHVVFMRNGTGIHSLTGLNPKESYVMVISRCGTAPSPEECVNRLNE